jgi:hypothetical protein
MSPTLLTSVLSPIIAALSSVGHVIATTGQSEAHNPVGHGRAMSEMKRHGRSTQAAMDTHGMKPCCVG